MDRCPNCGNKLSNIDVLCPKCGAVVEVVPTRNTGFNLPPVPDQTQNDDAGEEKKPSPQQKFYCI